MGSQVSGRLARSIAVTVVVAAFCLGAVYSYWVLFDHRFTVVTPGRVYQSAAMRPEALLEIVAREGIQTVFDFRGDSEASDAIRAERLALGEHGVRYLHIPSSSNPGADTINAFVRAMGTEMAAHRTVLLHCKDGEGRAVFYSAIYRMEFEGWDNQRAYDGTTRLPGTLMFLSDWIPSVRLSPYNVKTDLILHYTRHAESLQAER